MTGPLHRQLRVLLISAAVALGAWWFFPGTGWDRAAFKAVVSGFVNPPLFVSGKGTRAAPWKVQAFSSDSKPDKRQAPVIVSLGDDLDGFFQNSPPAPIDLAVVLTNFQRLGAKKAATAVVLAWETPDPIGLAALEKSLDRFESLVMAAPLSRGAVASSMPPAFRRASIPLTGVQGDASALPVVNRIPLPGVVLGGASTTAGFSVLESESPAKFAPLLARWEDRVVFSFPLLAVLQRLNLPTAGIEVRLGEYLKLGPAGPLVPIDDYGRLSVPLKPISAFVEISAEAVIDGGDELFPKQAPDPVILRDDRTAAEPATRAFSKMLSATVAALASDEGLAHASIYPRLAWGWEIGILACVAALLAAFSGAAESARHVGAAALAGVILCAQWITLGMASVWLPGLPLLAAILAAVVAAKFIRFEVSAPAPVLVAVPLPEIEIQPEPVIKVPEPKKTPAKKVAAKKTAAKKVAAKKTAAKKTAKTKTPRTKKPPLDS